MDARRLRERMVLDQIEARGVRDAAVLHALRSVDRAAFVPPELRSEAYSDTPLPLGAGQTISQPYIVGYMTQLLQLSGEERVLELGTGSGYQTAVLAVLAREVYTVEIVPELAESARERLAYLGYVNVHVKTGDGIGAWCEEAPFDRILGTAAPRVVPGALVAQLAEGGRMVIPVGAHHGDQHVQLVTRTPAGVRCESLLPVRFVPMTGEVERSEQE